MSRAVSFQFHFLGIGSSFSRSKTLKGLQGMERSSPTSVFSQSDSLSLEAIVLPVCEHPIPAQAIADSLASNSTDLLSLRLGGWTSKVRVTSWLRHWADLLLRFLGWSVSAFSSLRGHRSSLVLGSVFSPSLKQAFWHL